MDTPEPPVLDPAVFDRLRRIGGEPLVKRMIDTFMGYAPGQMEVITTSTRSGEADVAGNAAHSLKSSAGNIGAMGLFALCLEVEQAGRKGDMDNLPALAAELAVVFEQVCSHLASLVEQEGT
ncbi:MAG: Hpt domain-containing protein [Myxococcota bacterium]|nr:Hpt domain-containing protein [Myxococcota bacterium]